MVWNINLEPKCARYPNTRTKHRIHSMEPKSVLVPPYTILLTNAKTRDFHLLRVVDNALKTITAAFRLKSVAHKHVCSSSLLLIPRRIYLFIKRFRQVSLDIKTLILPSYMDCSCSVPWDYFTKRIYNK